ncbi:MAG: hypothetical protein ACYS3S_20600 [Planctomycetota bacterium]
MDINKMRESIIKKIEDLGYPEPSAKDDNYVVIDLHTNGLMKSLKRKTTRNGVHRVRVHVEEDKIVTFYDDSDPDVKPVDPIQDTVDDIDQFIQQLST